MAGVSFEQLKLTWCVMTDCGDAACPITHEDLMAKLPDGTLLEVRPIQMRNGQTDVALAQYASGLTADGTFVDVGPDSPQKYLLRARMMEVALRVALLAGWEAGHHGAAATFGCPGLMAEVLDKALLADKHLPDPKAVADALDDPAEMARRIAKWRAEADGADAKRA